MSFDKFKLLALLNNELVNEKITEPTDIQNKMIPAIKDGLDVIACSRTGSGKTLAFLLPLIDTLYRDRYRSKPKHTRALILAPTRLLAQQIERNLKTYVQKTKLRHYAIYPGTDIGVQKHETSRGLDIIVATPGRLLTLVRKNHILLSELEFAIVDEADLMLEMGFIRDLEEIFFKMPDNCQKIMCSATFNARTSLLADEILNNPVKFGVSISGKLASGIDQVMLRVEPISKPSLTAKLIHLQKIKRGIIFVETQKSVDRVTSFLLDHDVKVEAIHGGKTRREREESITKLADGTLDVLVATDVAARGLHIDYVTHVINYTLPRDPETYVHRLGRTARGKNRGYAISLCGEHELEQLKAIEKYLKLKIKQMNVEAEDSVFFSGDKETFGRRTPKKR